MKVAACRREKKSPLRAAARGKGECTSINRKAVHVLAIEGDGEARHRRAIEKNVREGKNVVVTPGEGKVGNDNSFPSGERGGKKGRGERKRRFPLTSSSKSIRPRKGEGKGKVHVACSLSERGGKRI